MFSFTAHSLLLRIVLAVPIAFSPAGYISDFAQGDVDRVLALTVSDGGNTTLPFFKNCLAAIYTCFILLKGPL